MSSGEVIQENPESSWIDSLSFQEKTAIELLFSDVKNTVRNKHPEIDLDEFMELFTDRLYYDYEIEELLNGEINPELMISKIRILYADIFEIRGKDQVLIQLPKNFYLIPLIILTYPLRKLFSLFMGRSKEDEFEELEINDKLPGDATTDNYEIELNYPAIKNFLAHRKLSKYAPQVSIAFVLSGTVIILSLIQIFQLYEETVFLQVYDGDKLFGLKILVYTIIVIWIILVRFGIVRYNENKDYELTFNHISLFHRMKKPSDLFTTPPYGVSRKKYLETLGYFHREMMLFIKEGQN